VTGVRTQSAVDPAGIGVDGFLDRASRLGFRDDDLTDLGTATARWLGTSRHRDELADRAERVRAGIGELTVTGDDPWVGLPAGPDSGLLPMLALLITADEVVAYQVRRGVGEDAAWRNLSDLGQQVRVHRLTYGRFGLHTHGWLRIAWAGGFAWLGRLQFNLQHLPYTGEWVLSTHIPRRSSDDDGPRSGALTPARVDASFRRAVSYFAERFGDVATRDFWCHSWLLAPELAEALPGSNIAAFQQRWTLDDRVDDGDEDALFFTFSRRSDPADPLDLGELPRVTSLERAVLDRLGAGEHWTLRRGRIPQASIPPASSPPATIPPQEDR
jgi:hypothetical protein